MNTRRPHCCDSCNGTGKVLSQRTRVFRGIKQTCEFLVDCPGKLMEVLLLDHPDLGSRTKSRTARD